MEGEKLKPAAHAILIAWVWGQQIDPHGRSMFLNAIDFSLVTE